MDVKNVEVVVLILLLFAIPTMSILIDYTYQPNELMRRYYIYLNYLWIRWRRKNNRWKRKILKPLGLCIYCQNVWIGIIYCIIFDINIKLIICIVPISFVILYFLKQKIDE